jgi:hypothetical protein
MKEFHHFRQYYANRGVLRYGAASRHDVVEIRR